MSELPSVHRKHMVSCSEPPASEEYERGIVTARLLILEQECHELLERIAVLEAEKSRPNSKPPDFEVQGPNGIRVRGKQIVGIVMALATAGVAVAYLLLRK